MAHFAKLDENNIVLNIEVVDNANCLDENGNESEEVGRQYLENIHGWTKWKQTSYNTSNGVHIDPSTGEPSSDQSKALRGTYATIGTMYDETNDIFIPANFPYSSWTLNTTTAVYEPPVDYPSVQTYTADDSTTKYYQKYWYEPNQSWRATKHNSDTDVYEWNPANSTWSLVT